MLPAERRDDAAAWGPLEETELEQIRLVDVLDRVRLLAQRDRQRGQSHRAAVEALHDGTQELAIHGLEAALVDLQQLEGLAGDVRCDRSVVPDFGDIAHTPENAVGDA